MQRLLSWHESLQVQQQPSACSNADSKRHLGQGVAKRNEFGRERRVEVQAEGNTAGLYACSRICLVCPVWDEEVPIKANPQYHSMLWLEPHCFRRQEHGQTQLNVTSAGGLAYFRG